MHKLTKVAAILTVLPILLCQSVFARQLDYVVEDEKRVPIPQAYEVTQIISGLGAGGTLNQAEDLFIDQYDNIFVADTQNNRIVKLDPSGNFVREYTEAPKGKAFNKPAGVYVDKTGDLYIADTDNNRIVHIAEDGSFIEEFVKPESELLGTDFTFNPSKVFIGHTGMLYVIKGQSFLSIDANNKFAGYVGSTKVGFNLRTFLIRMFATPEQKKKLAKAIPVSYSNFVIDDEGMIYAVTMDSKNQIRKINSVGENIYPKGIYGERLEGTTENPFFADITVDKDGIITILEQKSGKCYQYDQNGNMLACFGGIGSWKGAFTFPTSLAVNSKGEIYVLDRKMNNIQVFRPTKFINLVKQAVTHYSNGQYEETKELWEEVLKIDSNYTLARQGIGRVYYKEMQWKKAMDEFRMVEDKDEYSKAFDEYIHDQFRSNFTAVVLVIAFLLAFVIFAVTKLKMVADKVWEEEI